MTLGPLPPTFAATVAALHRVAEEDVSPARTDGHIWLAATPGGFGTPGGEARVEGAELVRGDTRTPLDVDPDAVRALAEWYALGDGVLSRLIAAAGPGDDPSEVRLWPEHFDIAIESGDEAAGARANYGFSPGDEDHPEPYAYVGPWTGGVEELSYDELRAAADPAAAALAFFTARSEA